MKKMTISNEEISTLCSELAIIIKSGLQVTDGLFVMVEEARDIKKKKLLSGINANIEKGMTLREALENTADFPPYMLQMVEIGEQTGHIEAVMASLAEYYASRDSISKTIRSAVIYPSVLAFTALAVIIVLAVFVLPIFSDVFSRLGLTMSASAVWFMDVGMVISRWAVFIIGGLVILAGIFVVLYCLTGFKRFVNKLFARTKLSKKMAAARFASALSLTLSSGMDIDSSVELCENLTDNQIMKEKFTEVRKKINSGESFVNAITEAKIFSGIYNGMINIGFDTGKIDTVMKDISEKSEEELTRSIQSIVNRFEPILVIIMSLIVGFVLVSVMLPLLSVMTVLA